MNRLPFTRELPDFTRRQWASAQARAVWQPRMQAATTAWLKIEQLSVLEGVRPSALMHCTPDELPVASAWAARRGLSVVPLAIVANSAQYSASSRVPRAGEPWAYRVALTWPAHVIEWTDAWQTNDDEAIGRLLGYPECCRRFFRRVWNDEAMIDTTWAMAHSTDPIVTRLVPVENNILLRWLGVRMVPHLPCGFDCGATVVLARSIMRVGRENGLGEAVDTIEEMLSWPVEWSALHGIAEIKTPVVKVSARTDATAEKYTVRLTGTRYPAEGARGNVFPYQPNPGNKLTETRSFQQLIQLGDARAWQDNGFTSRAAQERAHMVVVTAFSALPKIGNGGAILDLGCGNGDLLRALGARAKGAELWGIEIEQDRVVRGSRRSPTVDVLQQGDISDLDLWDGEFDCIVIMPGRLIEMATADAECVRSVLLQRARYLVVYAYGDWIERYSSFAALCTAAGLPVPRRMAGSRDAVAGFIKASAKVLQ